MFSVNLGLDNVKLLRFECFAELYSVVFGQGYLFEEHWNLEEFKEYACYL